MAACCSQGTVTTRYKLFHELFFLFLTSLFALLLVFIPSFSPYIILPLSLTPSLTLPHPISHSPLPPLSLSPPSYNFLIHFAQTKKSHGKGDATVDDVFMPKDDAEFHGDDEFELELNEFKRYILNYSL